MVHAISRRTMLCVTAGGALGSITGARAASNGTAAYPVALPLYAQQFVAMTQGFFKDEGLDVQLVPAGSGVKMRDIVAAGQADMGIGDVTHPLQLTNRRRPAKILSTVDVRNGSVMMVTNDAHATGLTGIEKLATWKRPDGTKPLVGLSSIGGTSYVWSSFFFERLKLDQAITYVGVGETDTMLGALKSKQIDVLVGSSSMLSEAKARGWGQLLFDLGDPKNWDATVGGAVPVTANFALASLVQKDRPRVQHYTNALLRASYWIRDRPVDDIYNAVEQFVGATSRDASLIELRTGKELLNVTGRLDEETFKRGGAVWFRDLTGIKRLALGDVYDSNLIEAANASIKG
jgi:NitT/TauT family transport system substrate-binding protein